MWHINLYESRSKVNYSRCRLSRLIKKVHVIPHDCNIHKNNMILFPVASSNDSLTSLISACFKKPIRTVFRDDLEVIKKK